MCSGSSTTVRTTAWAFHVLAGSRAEDHLPPTAADVLMLAGRYTLLDRSALDDVLPTARELCKSVVAAGVFNSGLLSLDRPVEGLTYDCQNAPPDLIARARAIAQVCEAHGTTLPAAAIAFGRIQVSSTSLSACRPRNRPYGT